MKQNKNIIIVTTENPENGYHNSYVDKSNYSGYKNQPDNWVNRVYLHGDLQGIAGYDLVEFLEGEFVTDGIFDVIVDLKDQKINSKMYLWSFYENDKLHVLGLIIDKNDDDKEYVEICYDQKRKNI
jgi:hypothetical protein